MRKKRPKACWFVMNSFWSGLVWNTKLRRWENDGDSTYSGRAKCRNIKVAIRVARKLYIAGGDPVIHRYDGAWGKQYELNKQCKKQLEKLRRK